MPELLTPRLRCSPLQLDDWSFFLSLQQDPQVMLSSPTSGHRRPFAKRSIRDCRHGRREMNTGCAWWCATGSPTLRSA